MKHIYIVLLLAFISFNCEQNAPDPIPLLPSVNTTTVTSIAANTAVTGGNVTTPSGLTITERGVCWGTSPNPTIAGNHISAGAGTGIFTSTITGLLPNTTYYVRAYATNRVGTSYGTETIFTTTNSTTALPTVITSSITAITATTATSGGNVVVDGGAAVTARGICWSTTADPVATGNHTTDGSGTGVFTSAITGLTAGTTYHVRAYATNSVGTAYGGDSVFTATAAAAPDVYVGGYSQVGSSGDIPTVWKNGVATLLPFTGTSADVNSIYVSGTDVHAAGFQTIGGSEAGLIWKNSTVTSNGLVPCGPWWARSVFVSGSDVYVVGEEDDCSSNRLARVWKNGVASTLSGGAFEAGASAVYVSGTDVYVAGYQNTSSSNYKAVIWKNGIATDLPTNAAINSEATAIFVNGTDVYVAGNEDNGTSWKAVYWKNGVRTALTNGTNEASVYSIFVSGTDIYCAGYEFNGTVYVAKVWKNGVATALTNGSNDAYAWSVFVYGSDVYVSGSEANGTNTTAKYWKNGLATILSSGVGIADGYSIFVK